MGPEFLSSDSASGRNVTRSAIDAEGPVLYYTSAFVASEDSSFVHGLSLPNTWRSSSKTSIQNSASQTFGSHEVTFHFSHVSAFCSSRVVFYVGLNTLFVCFVKVIDFLFVTV